MNLRHRDHCIYLVLISALAYMGMYFVEGFAPSIKDPIIFRACSHILLVLNSFIIYWFSFKYSQRISMAFLVSALYLVSPTHFDVFIFPFGLQAQLAETLLLLFFVSYYLGHQKKSFLLYLLATLANSKFMVFTPFLCFSKKFTSKQKTFFLISFFVQLIYLVPLFSEQKEFLVPNFKTIYYISEVLFFTPNLSFLNLALIVPKYYSLAFYIGGLILVVAGGRFFLRKNAGQDLTLVFIGIAFLGALVPFKQFIKTDEQVYYFSPTLYPTVLLFFLWALLVFLKKFELKKSILVCSSTLVFFWILMDVNFQATHADTLRSWDNAMYLLPKDFNFEEKIKLKYTNVLMEKNEDQRAEAYINLAKKKFPHEIWYSLLLSLASKRKDDRAIKQVYKDLLEDQVPFNNPAMEDN
ncbi:MAG: hypothetical protein ACXVLQ_01135 [Bacteriovorax sp.]